MSTKGAFCFDDEPDPQKRDEIRKEVREEQEKDVFELTRDDVSIGKLKESRDILFFNQYPDLKDTILNYRKQKPIAEEKKRKEREELIAKTQEKKLEENLQELDVFREEIREETIEELLGMVNEEIKKTEPPPKRERRRMVNGRIF